MSVKLVVCDSCFFGGSGLFSVIAFSSGHVFLKDTWPALVTAIHIQQYVHHCMERERGGGGREREGGREGRRKILTHVYHVIYRHGI